MLSNTVLIAEWQLSRKGQEMGFLKVYFKIRIWLSMINSQGMRDKDGKENFTI